MYRLVVKLRVLFRNYRFGICGALSDIEYNLCIPGSTRFMHKGLGVVISHSVMLGEHVLIYQNVTLGGRGNTHPGTPVIGNDVVLFTGCCVFGDVKIGDGAIVGANAVVVDDVPSGAVVVGVPAVVVKSKNMIKIDKIYR